MTIKLISMPLHSLHTEKKEEDEKERNASENRIESNIDHEVFHCDI